MTERNDRVNKSNQKSHANVSSPLLIYSCFMLKFLRIKFLSLMVMEITLLFVASPYTLLLRKMHACT